MSEQSRRTSASSGRTVDVGKRRTPEQRKRDRANGVDGFGRPTPRALGISPRQLMARDGVTAPTAKRLSAALYRAALEQGFGGAAPAYLKGLPALPGVSPEGPQEQPQAA